MRNAQWVNHNYDAMYSSVTVIVKLSGVHERIAYPAPPMAPMGGFSFQPVLHNWCTKGHGICYPAYGVVHIEDPLLLFRKSSPCGGGRFPFLLSELSVNKMC